MCDNPNGENNIKEVMENSNEDECELIKDSRYQMKLNRALSLYKSIGYINFNKIKRFPHKYKSSIIVFVIVMLFQCIISLLYFLSIVQKQNDLKSLYESLYFPLLLSLFSLYVTVLDGDVYKVENVDKELYEIALDIYDQLCLDQDDQDKRELKDYMERRFLNKKNDMNN